MMAIYFHPSTRAEPSSDSMARGTAGRIVGTKVIFVPFANGMPAGEPKDVLTGFLSPDGNAFGRPVGVKVDKTGALLVADDVGNTVWRVTPRGFRSVRHPESSFSNQPLIMATG